MYSDKKNILQLVALLKAHGVRKIVLCPGSRNAAIVHTLANIEEVLPQYAAPPVRPC